MAKNLGSISFYEIYPATFMDGNNDGVGDIKGIISKLDYVKAMGFGGIWFNPFFKSPFLDGGYDIEDYFKIDKRFGSNELAYKLIEECHKRGLLVLFDLVAGHMSWNAPLFLESAKAFPNPESKDMFIWSNTPWTWSNKYPFIKGLYPRFGSYFVNFFVHQPALNYGFSSKEEPWMETYEGEGPKKTRKLIVDVMKFWCSHGVDGYRCDMADSLVKNDSDTKELTRKTWKEMFEEVRKTYPDMIAVSEWSNPRDALRAGFDMDFVLDHPGNFSNLFFRNGENDNGFSQEGKEPLLIKFNKQFYEAAINDLSWRYEKAKENKGYLSLISGNHDTWRIASFLEGDALKDAYVIIMTLPGIPYVFAGDELEQTHKFGYPSKDGGYQRTGSRFAMNWDASKKNHGFSKAHKTYLPIAKGRKDAKESLKDPSSLLNFITKLNHIRLDNEEFKDNENLKILDKPFSFERGRILVCINLLEEPMEIDLEPGTSLLEVGRIAYTNDKKAILQPRASLIYKRK